MPPFEQLIAFAAATAVFAYMPGPAMLYATAQTLAHGRRAGWMAVLGMHVGGFVHGVAAALGLFALFEAVPPLYAALKIAGAFYLVWLGIKLWRAGPAPADAAMARALPVARTAFRQSVVVELLNPKSAVFYLAFLPQFVDPSAALPIWAQFLVLSAIVNVAFSSADIVCVMAAHAVATRLRRTQAATRIVRRVGGSILIALGLNLAFSRNG